MNAEEGAYPTLFPVHIRPLMLLVNAVISVSLIVESGSLSLQA